METAQLKKFAQEARKSLMGTVEAKLGVVLAPDSLARREQQSAIVALEGLISEIGQEQVIEKVAYTWFNRFCALRFMDVNHYTKIGIVSPAENQTQPEILAEAKMGYYDDSVINSQTKEQINRLLNVSQDDAYKTLLVAYCNSFNKLMPFMFERINDYTELLMPDNLLAQNSILSRAVEVLTLENCKDVEVIGWLYQYYISEKKDEVFADLKKGKKISKENVPAATQIFTPKWIVKYMVENSVGKMWLESHPDNKLQSQFKYYLESAEQEEDVKAKLEELKNKDLKPQDIKVLDPACGSGHILVTAFDVLFEIYKSVGYQENEIPELILKHNLYGLDICDRAAQLSQFAVMMKAREYDRNIFNKVHDLNICAIKDTNWIDTWVENELLQDTKDKNYAKEQVDLLKDTFKDAKEYGSIIDVKGIDFEFWNERLEYIRNLGQQQANTPKIRGRLPYILKQAKIMQQQYECVIANPPYMGNKGMSEDLSAYVKKKYPMSKGDMFAIFKEVILNHTKNNCYSSTINQHSWMFLSSYEDLRNHLLNNACIDTMIHLGSRAFEEIGGEVVQSTTYTTKKIKIDKYIGKFAKLTEYSNASLKEEKYLEFNSNNIYTCKQNGFHSIPSSPIAYWASDLVRKIFAKENPLGNIAQPRQGMATSDNNRFLRLWQEVDFNKIGLGCKSDKEAYESEKKWFPYNKGGEFRKWYGNNEYLLNYYKNGEEVLQYAADLYGSPTRTIKNIPFYFQESATWSFISSTAFGVRYSYPGAIFDVGGSSAFISHNKIKYLVGFLCSKIVFEFLKLLNPTLNFQSGNVASLPFIYTKNNDIKENIDTLVDSNIIISKQDWDSFEISWDFEKHPLLRFNQNGKVKEAFETWQQHSEQQFNKLKANEEELNRLFIEIYGLQDEMTPDVEDKDITIRKADEVREIKSLMSYAVGCMFGRYSLDKEGLVFAGGEFNKDDYKIFEADDDGIIPILSEHYFSDDITERFKKFIKATFGETHYEENMDYIASVLGRKNNETADDTIRNYFIKDFYNDHVKTYQKRPIYWLFSSKNGNFNALVYLHRYNKDTVNRILNNYLREYRGKLEQSINNDKQILTSAVSDRDKSKAQKEIEIAQKIVNEVTDYERDVIYPLATERKEIDLDDGVKENYLKFGKALKDIGLKAKK